MMKQPTVLIVEDDDLVRDVTASCIDELGYDVLMAADAETALRLLGSPQPVDLLLADIVLPGRLDGLGLAEEARRRRPGLKVLHVTGFAERLFCDGRRMLPDELVIKPFGRDELQTRVARLLGGWAVERNPVLRRAHEYWQAKRGDRPFPDRRDLVPWEITALLPHVVIVEPVGWQPAPRFRFRLVGTRICDVMGLDPTGRHLDEIQTGDYGRFLHGLYADVIGSGTPVYSASRFQFADTGFSTERLWLPFSRGGQRVAQVVGFQTFERLNRKIPVHAIMQLEAGRADVVERMVAH